MASTGHAFEEHTSEVRIRLWAPTVPALFEQAARALAELYVGRRVEPAAAMGEPIALQATDRDALLADFLNELVYRTERSGRVYPSVRLDEWSDQRLAGAVGGVSDPPPTTSIKAATMHDLRIRPSGDGYVAQVVVDV